MNKTHCNIIKDLLPLYVEKMISDESKIMVEEHLDECSLCKKEYDELKLRIPVENDTNIAPFKKLKKTFFRKKIILSVISVLCAMVVMIGGYSVLNKPIEIEFNESLVSFVKLNHGEILMTLSGEVENYTCCFTREDKKSSNSPFICYITLTTSIWNKYIHKDESRTLEFNQRLMSNENNSLVIGYIDLKAIYYRDSSIDIHAPHQDNTDILIWPK
ncbi:MAG: zf-HC2 domain-containing protein [Eubacteriales bacterium]